MPGEPFGHGTLSLEQNDSFALQRWFSILIFFYQVFSVNYFLPQIAKGQVIQKFRNKWMTLQVLDYSFFLKNVNIGRFNFFVRLSCRPRTGYVLRVYIYTLLNSSYNLFEVCKYSLLEALKIQLILASCWCVTKVKFNAFGQIQFCSFASMCCWVSPE